MVAKEHSVLAMLLSCDRGLRERILLGAVSPMMLRNLLMDALIRDIPRYRGDAPVALIEREVWVTEGLIRRISQAYFKDAEDLTY